MTLLQVLLSTCQAAQSILYCSSAAMRHDSLLVITRLTPFCSVLLLSCIACMQLLGRLRLCVYSMSVLPRLAHRILLSATQRTPCAAIGLATTSSNLGRRRWLSSCRPSFGPSLSSLSLIGYWRASTPLPNPSAEGSSLLLAVLRMSESIERSP